LAALVVSPAQDIRAKRETEKWNDRGILNTAQMGVSQDPKMMVFYSENDGTSVVGGEFRKDWNQVKQLECWIENDAPTSYFYT
jgi:hypothetical protein